MNNESIILYIEYKAHKLREQLNLIPLVSEDKKQKYIKKQIKKFISEMNELKERIE